MQGNTALAREQHTTAATTITTDQQPAQLALTIMRLTLGALFVWVFFENLGKNLYTSDGYAGLINFYINESTAPKGWKGVMRVVADNAPFFAPLQAVSEITFGVLLLLGVFTRPVALGAFVFLATLWISELGTAWIWELLVPMAVALSLAVGAAGRKWGVDGFLRSRLRPIAQRGSGLARLALALT
jgi:uncharacterized membrane protein YphA (DoxX/SURF4 family)